MKIGDILFNEFSGLAFVYVGSVLENAETVDTAVKQDNPFILAQEYKKRNIIDMYLRVRLNDLAPTKESVQTALVNVNNVNVYRSTAFYLYKSEGEKCLNIESFLKSYLLKYIMVTGETDLNCLKTDTEVKSDLKKKIKQIEEVNPNIINFRLGQRIQIPNYAKSGKSIIGTYYGVYQNDFTIGSKILIEKNNNLLKYSMKDLRNAIVVDKTVKQLDNFYDYLKYWRKND